MKGIPKTMQDNPQYSNVVSEVLDFLKAKASVAQKHGIEKEKIILDPGIGFGKTLNQNLQLMKSLKKFSSANIQVLLGSSRKSWINYIDPSNADERIGGSLASVAHALKQNVHTYRIHDVKETNQMIKVLKALNK